MISSRNSRRIDKRKRREQRPAVPWRAVGSDHGGPQLYAKLLTGEESNGPTGDHLRALGDEQPILWAGYRDGLCGVRPAWVVFSTAPLCPCPEHWPIQRENAAELWPLLHANGPQPVEVSPGWQAGFRPIMYAGRPDFAAASSAWKATLPLPAFMGGNDIWPPSESVKGGRQEDDFGTYTTTDGQ